MPNIPPTLLIAMTEAGHAIVAGAPLTDQLRAAMGVTRDHWVCTNEDEQFRAAVGAVMTHYGAESLEYARLKWELAQLQRFSAALGASQAGVGMDWTDVLKESEYEPIGLLGLWRA
jgi:hypothetical protein